LETVVNARTVELKEANDSLASANEQLKIRDRMQQDFINIAAHEIRTPIQPILGLTGLLRSQITDLEQQGLLDINRICHSIDANLMNEFILHVINKY
jgi:signal transduction histidine kinase